MLPPVVAIVWFRRDLRVHDHPALRAALAAHDRVVPVFCFDDRLLHGRHASGPRTQFLLESLADLDRQLAARGAGLLVRRGQPEAVLPALARAAAATEVHVTADGSPYDRQRAARVAAALAAAGAVMHAHPGQHVADDPAAILTGPGRPYTVFTPYFRNWDQTPRRPPLAAPDRVRLPDGLRPGGLPSLRDLGFQADLPAPARGGETAGIARLDQFLAAPVHDYTRTRDLAGPGSTSRLSPYLRFGCLSARAVEAQLPSGDGAAAFRRQLCWRDFYQQLLVHFPGNVSGEFQERYRGRLAWNSDEQGFAAWTQGRTGFPLVDAGMRQLRREGWLPGPVRLVVACFLVKDLGIDWRQGEAWFMRLLLDGDEAVNNGNWQWIASVGTDRQPVSRRLYNPARQQERQDPEGRYVRTFLPELSRVPWEYLNEPWRMPPEVQRKAGCRIGRDYPAPIVDHRAARLAALARYAAARGAAADPGKPAASWA